MQSTRFGRSVGVLFFTIGAIDTLLAMLRRFEWFESKFPQGFKAVLTPEIALILMLAGMVLMWQTRPRHALETVKVFQGSPIRSAGEASAGTLPKILLSFESLAFSGRGFVARCIDEPAANVTIRAIERLGYKVTFGSIPYLSKDLTHIPCTLTETETGTPAGGCLSLALSEGPFGIVLECDTLQHVHHDLPYLVESDHLGLAVTIRQQPKATEQPASSNPKTSNSTKVQIVALALIAVACVSFWIYSRLRHVKPKDATPTSEAPKPEAVNNLPVAEKAQSTLTPTTPPAPAQSGARKGAQQLAARIFACVASQSHTVKSVISGSPDAQKQADEQEAAMQKIGSVCMEKHGVAIREVRNQLKVRKLLSKELEMDFDYLNVYPDSRSLLDIAQKIEALADRMQ
jgi:hypothetical protein